MSEHKLDQKTLKYWLRYNPETGNFRWNHVRRKARKHAIAGCLARDSHNKKYIAIGLHKKVYKAHRLAWLYMTGDWPEYEIDHIDRNSINNAWHNLRDVPRSLNQQNRALANKSGYRGVVKRGRRYTARLHGKKNKGRKHLGTFDTAEEAHEVWQKTAKQLYGDDCATDCKGGR